MYNLTEMQHIFERKEFTNVRNVTAQRKHYRLVLFAFLPHFFKNRHQ